jgi:DNA primase
VAVPISWDELDEVDPNGVSFADVTQRFDLDPWQNMVTHDFGAVATQVDEALDTASIELEPFDRFRS